MYNTIIHATDLSDNHFEMCQQALSIAKKFSARLYLMHIIETPTSVQVAQGLGFAEIEDPTLLVQDAKAVMAVLGESLQLPQTQLFVEYGAIKQHLFDKVAELDCKLIIVGHHTPSAVPIYLGSTARLIVDEAPCDVLTLR